ncbi:cytochrome P450 oxidoreductase [Tricladium varicosporioides]|nr:cytochrome P450 oxidoreductase [Hymenoscyphus varicosporioides]
MDFFTVSIFHLGKHVLYLPLLAAVIFVKVAFWVRILYRYRRPLSAIPGPTLAPWTRFWIVKTLASGRSHEIFIEINKKYGSLARIGPNHLITNDPATTRRILGVRSGYERGPWFDSIKIDPHVPNIVSERCEEKHRKLRHKLAASYNGKNVALMEPVIDKQIEFWISRAKREWTSPSSDNLKTFDIGRRLQFLTVDIITKICLGQELGMVASDSDKYDFLKTIQQGNAVCQHFSVLLEINTLMYYFAKIPYIGRVLVPKPTDISGVGKILGIIHKIVEKRPDTKVEKPKDMLDAFINNGVPRHQIDPELAIALVAGSDTTSTSVQATLLAIITNPRVYRRLKAEIATCVSEGRAPGIIQDCESRQLTYLQACLSEGLRKFPPLSQLRERMVPPEGDIIQGIRVPGGTYVGFNAWGTQLNSVFGEDPEAFRPERWLIDDKERLQQMYQTQELIFGHGSTKCLGMPMALMELRKMIFELLRNFDITIANSYKPWSSTCRGIFFQENFNVHMTLETFGNDTE